MTVVMMRDDDDEVCIIILHNILNMPYFFHYILICYCYAFTLHTHNNNIDTKNTPPSILFYFFIHFYVNKKDMSLLRNHPSLSLAHVIYTYIHTYLFQ